MLRRSKSRAEESVGARHESSGPEQSNTKPAENGLGFYIGPDIIQVCVANRETKLILGWPPFVAIKNGQITIGDDASPENSPNKSFNVYEILSNPLLPSKSYQLEINSDEKIQVNPEDAVGLFFLEIRRELKKKEKRLPRSCVVVLSNLVPPVGRQSIKVVLECIGFASVTFLPATAILAWNYSKELSLKKSKKTIMCVYHAGHELEIAKVKVKVSPGLIDVSRTSGYLKIRTQVPQTSEEMCKLIQNAVTTAKGGRGSFDAVVVMKSPLFFIENLPIISEPEKFISAQSFHNNSNHRDEYLLVSLATEISPSQQDLPDNLPNFKNQIPYTLSFATELDSFSGFHNLVDIFSTPTDFPSDSPQASVTFNGNDSEMIHLIMIKECRKYNDQLSVAILSEFAVSPSCLQKDIRVIICQDGTFELDDTSILSEVSTPSYAPLVSSIHIKEFKRKLRKFQAWLDSCGRICELRQRLNSQLEKINSLWESVDFEDFYNKTDDLRKRTHKLEEIQRLNDLTDGELLKTAVDRCNELFDDFTRLMKTKEDRKTCGEYIRGINASLRLQSTSDDEDDYGPGVFDVKRKLILQHLQEFKTMLLSVEADVDEFQSAIGKLKIIARQSVQDCT